MSLAEWQADTEPLDNQVGEPSKLQFPEDWQYSTSWQRAQTDRDRGVPSKNDAERFVWLEESDTRKRVVFALDGRTLRAQCECAGFHHRGWCAHKRSEQSRASSDR